MVESVSGTNFPRDDSRIIPSVAIMIPTVFGLGISLRRAHDASSFVRFMSFGRLRTRMCSFRVRQPTPLWFVATNLFHPTARPTEKTRALVHSNFPYSAMLDPRVVYRMDMVKYCRLDTR